MDDRQKLKDAALDHARSALALLDELRERNAAALIQQAIDDLNGDDPEVSSE